MSIKIVITDDHKIAIGGIVSMLQDNPDFTIIGLITEKEKGCQLITKSGNAHELQAQGWTAF